jgi:hypothetical protein
LKPTQIEIENHGETISLIVKVHLSMEQFNPDLGRGILFRNRSKELLVYLKQNTISSTYLGRDIDLAKALCIGYRSISRYLRYLKTSGQIEIIKDSRKKHREIFIRGLGQG